MSEGLSSGPPFGSWRSSPPQQVPPLIGPDIGHDHRSYIPQDMRYPPLHSSAVHSHRFLSSDNSEGVSHLVPNYPPPPISHDSRSQLFPFPHLSHHAHYPTNIHQGCAPSPARFSEPLPSLTTAPDFSKPPPSVTYDEKNIPQTFETQTFPQKPQSSDKSTAKNYSPPWNRNPLPQVGNSQPLPQTMNLVYGSMALSNRAENTSGGLVKDHSEENLEDEDLKWLQEFQQQIKTRHGAPLPVKTMSRARTVKVIVFVCFF